MTSTDTGHPDEPAAEGVGTPPNVQLPLFTYGLLQPGELAHPHVIGPDVRCEIAALPHAALRIRDGLPLLSPSPSQDTEVHGYLIWFDEPKSAYERVGDFEPRRQYRWGTAEVTPSKGERVCANVLFGRSPLKGSSLEPVDRWCGDLDPVLSFGLSTVTDMVGELAKPDFPIAPGDSKRMWERFFRLSATYLLLWSIVERYTALRFGPALGAHARVRALGRSVEFRAAVRAADVQSTAPLIDGLRPTNSYRIKPDGSGAAEYWYAVRSNLSHRGKSAFKDGQLLRHCTLDLHHVTTLLLQR